MKYSCLEEELLAQGYRRVATVFNSDLLDTIQEHFPDFNSQDYKIVPCYLALRKKDEKSLSIDYLMHNIYLKE